VVTRNGHDLLIAREPGVARSLDLGGRSVLRVTPQRDFGSRPTSNVAYPSAAASAEPPELKQPESTQSGLSLEATAGRCRLLHGRLRLRRSSENLTLCGRAFDMRAEILRSFWLRALLLL